MQQQLAQGFASGSPADVFYMDAARFADYAKNGSLYPYADQVSDNNDFYESLRQTFTYDGKQYCIPKDFSTLALQINTDSWDEGRPDRRRHPDHVGPARGRVEEAHHQGPGGPGHRRRHRPARRVRRAERRVVAQRGRLGARGEHPGGHPGPGVGAEERQGRQLQDVQRARLRLGRRGVRHRQGRDDDRGQLDQGRREERLPEARRTRPSSCPPARRARAPCSSPSAGASPPTPRPRPRPSTS